MALTPGELVKADHEHLIHPLHHPIDNAEPIIYVKGRGAIVRRHGPEAEDVQLIEQQLHVRRHVVRDEDQRGVGRRWGKFTHAIRVARSRRSSWSTRTRGRGRCSC